MYWISQWSLRSLVDYLTCDKTRLRDQGVTVLKKERRRGNIFLAQTYLNIWSFLSQRCHLIINTGQLRNKVGFSFLPKLQIIGSCSLTSKYKTAGSRFTCHILLLQRSRTRLKNSAVVSDGQWHQQTAYCQHPGWQMTITIPMLPGIWAIWDPGHHRQLVLPLPLLPAVADAGLWSRHLHGQTRHENRLFYLQGQEDQTGNPLPWEGVLWGLPGKILKSGLKLLLAISSPSWRQGD